MTQTTTSAAPAAPSPAPRTTTSTKKAARKPAPRKTTPAPAPQKKTVKTVKTAVTKKKPAQDKAPGKIKRVRDSFVMPRDEYEVLGALKKRSAGLGRPSKKSELLRAGLKLLAALNDKALQTALQAVPSTKADRPGKT